IPQLKEAPYISSNFVLISSCVGIFLDHLLKTAGINEFFVMFSLFRSVVKKTETKFVLIFSFLIKCNLIPFFISLTLYSIINFIPFLFYYIKVIFLKLNLLSKLYNYCLRFFLILFI